MMDTLEQSIIELSDPSRYEAQKVENTLRDLSLGITPLNASDPRNPGVAPTRKCDGCGQSESDSHKFLLCGVCRMVNYCSAECQKTHWKESHKKVCSQLTGATETEGKGIVQEMKRGDVSSLITLQRNDEVYAMAKKHGLLAEIERLFRLEAEGKQTADRTCYSSTQEIIVNIFKGNREVIERFTCACPVRAKEYILSSSTAWDSLMDAMLYLANALNKEEFQSLNMRNEQTTALAHRAARDAFATINLTLVHKKVAKALFYRSKTTGKRSQSEAKDYALDTMVPKLKIFFRNGGEGFAPDHVDRNQTIQANIFSFSAMLSYWYRTLDIDPENPNAFSDAMKLNDIQETMFETLARPLGEGMIELGRSLTMEETRARSLKANTEYQQRKKNGKQGGKKGGKKKNRNRR
eukprot:CAMPEP_0201890682 /NCGR_PEP_ID=MMETSP0902-20130614/32733_1 /ASSEMBLY_ACC=CAM_ASM_000551 /TAXON_ID=420261 /ORGANISM="Thalassiosira antarctica, Strain CCMP982" /LENGTH=407 /DNA_ID=CAMNT_0048421609 /DNA_START=46 /DNA_END=1269 /DNA_ORIENTATION=-